MMDLGSLLPSIQIDIADIFNPSDIETQQQPAHPRIIQHLPRETRAPPSQQCSICMDSETSGADASWTRLFPCGHRFHRACCVRWLEQHHTCPLCREQVQLNTEGMTTRQMLDLLNELGIERDASMVERSQLNETLQRALARSA